MTKETKHLPPKCNCAIAIKIEITAETDTLNQYKNRNKPTQFH